MAKRLETETEKFLSLVTLARAVSELWYGKKKKYYQLKGKIKKRKEEW